MRAVLGALFVGHGTQKLFGWFEGEGLRDTGEAFDSIGLHPGRAQATTAGVSETVGGALIATGFLTPVGCALIRRSKACTPAKDPGSPKADGNTTPC